MRHDPPSPSLSPLLGAVPTSHAPPQRPEFRPQLLTRVVRVLGGLLLALGAYAVSSQLVPHLLPDTGTPPSPALPRAEGTASQAALLRGVPLFGNLTR